MTSRDFCYWLQGYIEIRANELNPKGLNTEQVKCIEKHLALVFRHEIDPSFGVLQEELSDIHSSWREEPKIMC